MNPETRLVVGIDFAKNHASLGLLRGDGQILEQERSVANSLSGFQQAKHLLLETLQNQHLESLDLAGEATSYYWLPMFAQLAQDPDLAPYHPALFLLNARWVKWFKLGKSPNHKDDQVDPLEIADYVLVHRPRTAWQFEPRWLALRFYTRLRFHLVKSLTREKNLLDVYLFLLHATYSRRRPFSKSLAKTSQNLLTQPELLAKLAQLPLEAASDMLLELSGNRLPEPLDNARRLQQVLSESFPLHEDLGQPLQEGLEMLIETINHLGAQIKAVEARIERLVQDGFPEVAWLDSIPGIGLVLASGLASEIGNLERFSQQERWDKRRKCYRLRKAGELTDAIGKYAGLWWPKNASGQFEAEERRLSREGNAYLRYYIIEAGDCMRRVIPSFATYYQKKHDQAYKHKHKRASVLTGRKALDLIVALLRHRKAYQAKEGDQPVS